MTGEPVLVVARKVRSRFPFPSTGLVSRLSRSETQRTGGAGGVRIR